MSCYISVDDDDDEEDGVEGEGDGSPWVALNSSADTMLNTSITQYTTSYPIHLYGDSYAMRVVTVQRAVQISQSQHHRDDWVMEEH